MKLPVHHSSTTKRVSLTFPLILVVTALLYWFFLTRIDRLIFYHELIERLDAMRVAIVKLEYIVDMFVISGSTSDGENSDIKEEVRRMDRDMKDLLNHARNMEFPSQNIPLLHELESMSNDWFTIKNEIDRLNGKLSQEEIILIHNAVDLNAFLIAEKMERLLKIISDNEGHVIEEVKAIVGATLLVLILIPMGVMVMLVRRTVTPLKETYRTAQGILGGDMRVRFREDVDGEVGALNEMLNRVLDKVGSAVIEKEGHIKNLKNRLSELSSQLDSITGLNRKTECSLSRGEILTIAVEEIHKGTGADATVGYVKDEKGIFRAITQKDIDVGGEHTILKNISRYKECRIFKDMEEYPDEKFKIFLRKVGMSSFFYIPVMDREGIRGIIYALFRDGMALKEGDMPFIEAVASTVGTMFGYGDMFYREHNAKKFFSRIIQQSPFGLGVFDRNGVCLMLNSTFKKLFDVDENELIGRYSVLEDDLLESLGAMPFIKRSYDGYVTEVVVDYAPNFNSRYKFRGSPRKLRIKGFPLFDASGDISNIVLIYEDLSPKTLRASEGSEGELNEEGLQ